MHWRENAMYILFLCVLGLFVSRCGNINFARRDKCNRCGAPRPDDASTFGADAGYGGGGGAKKNFAQPGFSMKPGDWQCPAYATLTCF